MGTLRLWLLLIALFCGMAPLGAVADDDDGHDEYERDYEYEDDHRRARQAFERGEIMSLGALLENVDAIIPGEIIDVEFEKEDGIWVYEIYVVDKNGNLLEVFVDASTGSILKIEGR
ncbi:MAG: PepSY domain-containing protein [Alphaproteobacteria bacterium]|nr:PepSY domain-containing protein [Alphaproteobacteria bacterium]